MLVYFIIGYIALGVAFFSIPLLASAHLPRIVTQNRITVETPEVSKAYYGELTGEPHVYLVESDKDFTLYLNLLVPRITNGDARYGANIIDTATNRPIAVLPADSVQWTPYYEEFGGDWYMKGPEFEKQLVAGSYSIIISGNGDKGKYVLATGKKEEFPLPETVNALQTIPKLKNEFLGSGAPSFALSVMGGAYIIFLLLVGFISGMLVRFAFCTLKGKKYAAKNSGWRSRLFRGFLSIALMTAGIVFWIPVVHLLAGFVFYVALSSWCPLITPKK